MLTHPTIACVLLYNRFITQCREHEYSLTDAARLRVAAILRCCAEHEAECVGEAEARREWAENQMALVKLRESSGVGGLELDVVRGQVWYVICFV
jgi:hypothetical protein